MKRLLVPVCLLSIGFFLVVQYSFAGIGAGCGGGCKGNNSQVQQPLDVEAKKKYEKFMQETVELRKEMGEKAAQYQSLVASENPDSSKAALLTEEYFQLRNFLQEQAIRAGIAPRKSGCNGCNGSPGVACGLPGSGANIEQTN